MYLHRLSCISAQTTHEGDDLAVLKTEVNNMMQAREPVYEQIPLNILRRMGKAVRLSVGASLPLVRAFPQINGIILGTANGGMEDCIKFLNQVIVFQEGTLTPTNFVQSTPNAIAAQIGLQTKNNGYNITHVHRGLAFENAMIDARMYLDENPNSQLLVGGVDEISEYNYNIERLGKGYRQQRISNTQLYETMGEGSIAGEGVAMFIVNSKPQNAKAKISFIKTFSTRDASELTDWLADFRKDFTSQKPLSLFLSGENGDCRLSHFYQGCESVMESQVPVARFKHFTGEFPTAMAVAVYLAARFINQSTVPSHFMKYGTVNSPIRSVLIYNSYKGEQHSFMLVEHPGHD